MRPGEPVVAVAAVLFDRQETSGQQLAEVVIDPAVEYSGEAATSGAIRQHRSSAGNSRGGGVR
ncbi:uncharacterized protein YpuA (DUF1002 family) [Haloactinomyces albus]|uniref:Uncharacterized protein YpuA (DUF1002 family) n=1 Tax=Haloactinomyces albus TaxID=1352928 RepID=A0AAE4CNM6_9ACTN|nr:uncharacterized protein YpuA (DUF1002 family) [Haloactinomyces albus]